MLAVIQPRFDIMTCSIDIPMLSYRLIHCDQLNDVDNLPAQNSKFLLFSGKTRQNRNQWLVECTDQFLLSESVCVLIRCKMQYQLLC